MLPCRKITTPFDPLQTQDMRLEIILSIMNPGCIFTLKQQIEAELSQTEEHLERVTGQKPLDFEVLATAFPYLFCAF